MTATSFLQQTISGKPFLEVDTHVTVTADLVVCLSLHITGRCPKTQTGHPPNLHPALCKPAPNYHM